MRTSWHFPSSLPEDYTNIGFVDNVEFDKWIQDNHIAMLNDPSIQMTQFEADGKTVRKVFTYKSASRRSPDQLVWSRGLFIDSFESLNPAK